MSLNPSSEIAAQAVLAEKRTPFVRMGDEYCPENPQVQEEIRQASLDKLPKFVRIHRAWYYWMVDLNDRALPEKQSIALFEQFGVDVRPFGHCDMDRALFDKYLSFTREHNRKVREDSWSPKERAEWDAVTRITGKKAELKPEGVNMWHVDSVEGLAALSAHLRWYFLGEDDA